VTFMIRNGLYSLTALVIDGPDVEVGGVLILHDGRIHGGDSFVFYDGTYESSDGRWTGKLVSREHTPTARPVEERVQQISFMGSYTDAGAKVTATAVVDTKRILYAATLRLLAG
jgi:hypothetical protein